MSEVLILRDHETREALRALVERIRPKREYCAINGESYCRDFNMPDVSSCGSCNRWRWADALDAVLSTAEAEEKADALPGTTRLPECDGSPYSVSDLPAHGFGGHAVSGGDS